MLGKPRLHLATTSTRGLTRDLAFKYLSQGANSIGYGTVQNTYFIEDLDGTDVQLVFSNPYPNAEISPSSAVPVMCYKAIVAFAYGVAADGYTPLNSAGQPDNTMWQPVAGANNLIIQPGTSSASPNYGRSYSLTGWQPMATQGPPGLKCVCVRTYGFIISFGLTGEIETSNTNLALASLTWAGGLVTATTSAAHGLTGTFPAIISGVTPYGYNGNFPATVTGASTFTYPLAANPGLETTPGSYSPTPSPWATIDQGRHHTSYFAYTKDGVSVPGGWASNANPQPSQIIYPAVLMVRSRNPGVSSAWVGDSLTQGYRTQADHNSWGFKAAAIASRNGLPCSNANFGVSGSTSANFLQEALSIIAAVKPSHASIPPWTANDNPTGQSTAFDNGYNQMLTFVQACVNMGITPVIQSGFPIYNNQSANQPYVLSSHLRARAFAQANGFPYVDFYNGVGDPTVGFDQPKFMNAIWNYGDTHLDDLGTTQAALAVVAGLYQPFIDAL